MRKGFNVKFNSHEENCFYVTDLSGRTTRYPCDERGLYVKEVQAPIDCCVYGQCHVTTVEGFTQRGVERSARARKLYHDLSAENVGNLKVWIRSNLAKNVPVLVEDIDLAERIFKADVATCKGKSVRPHPPVVTTSDIIELPHELEIEGREVELAMDVVFINDQSFLHTVDGLIRYHGLVALGTRKKDENYTSEVLFEGLDEILRFYNKAGVYVKRIHTDNEF